MLLKHRRLIALLLIAVMALTGCGLDDEDDIFQDDPVVTESPATSTPAAGDADPSDQDKSDSTPDQNDRKNTGLGSNSELFSISDASGISRTVRNKVTPMGADGTWTICVYICGADLESRSYAATTDIIEMMDSMNGQNMNFVIETGGARSWYDDYISADVLSRYIVKDGDLELVDTQPKASMGESSTLASFLEWGVKNYPAGNMGLILWDHGSGSINGVCFDENADSDSLLLSELDAALYTVYEKMTDKFEFIGFDACLMSSVETAAKLATHANYMIASEETEPGSGWDYTAIGKYLEKNPNANGADLGKQICESFFAACEDDGGSQSCTLSVTDLSKIDNVILTFRDYAEDVYNAVSDSGTLNTFVRKVYEVDNYGGNNHSEGYSNMIDLCGLINAGSDLSSNAKAALDAVNNAVVYKKNGSYNPEAGGLSTYYPLEIQGSSELTIFRDICISSYYLGLVDMLAYGFANDGNIDDYSNDDVIDYYFDDYTWNFYDWDDGEFWYDPEDYDYYLTDLDDVEPTGESAAITFDVEPYVDEDYVYGFVLSEEGLMNAASVQAQLYMLSSDGEDIISIGLTSDVRADWYEGVFTDNFDGYWLSLPNGEQLNITLVEECDGYDIFTAPILLNDEETNLRLIWDYEYDEAYIIDIWEGIDDNGFAARCGTTLEVGDVIVPLYSAFSIEGDEEYWYYGSEYVYDGNDYIDFAYLPDGEYFYAFCIDDIYGDYLITDFVKFDIEYGEIYFDPDF